MARIQRRVVRRHRGSVQPRSSSAVARHAHSVAGFEHEVGCGQGLVSASPDPRDRRPETLGEFERRDRQPDDCVVGDDDSAKVEFANVSR